MLTLRQITLSRGHKILLEQASVGLYEKQKIGLVGRNGCGKSSLFALLRGELVVDSGEIEAHAHLRIGHLSQELPDSNVRAIDFVLAGDDAYWTVQQRLIQAEQAGEHDVVLACHETLSQTAGYSRPAQAASILSGLGFSAAAQEAPVNSFSGGWRMRLSLARCLMKPADLLLLDEPTNHLDMEAIFWLERWLKQLPCTVVTISHDREFLDAFVTHILHVEQQSLRVYTGNYSQFEQERAQRLMLQQAQYEKQSQKMNHMLAYVARFRAKASKAAQAQSRLKAISKMELVAKAQIDSPFSFEFYPCPRVGKPMLQCEQVTVGYQASAPILTRMNIAINPGDRIALLGPNGEGKSTLVKTLVGELEPLEGRVSRSPHLSVGYYAQHQFETLDEALSPIETIQVLSPEAREQSIRDFLGGFNFLGDMATHSIRHFSGGEKARLALAKLVWLKPNLLLLDEPTNHLDLDMRSAIEIALQSYEGALILISHDRHLLKTTVDEFYLVYQKQVKAFDGDVDDYLIWLQKQNAVASPKKEGETTAAHVHRERRGISNRLKKLEQIMQDKQHALKQVEVALAESSLYEPEQRTQLETLLRERQALEEALEQAEEEWLALAE